MDLSFFIADLDNKKFTDVTIIFKDRYDEVCRIDAHKVILASASPFMNQLFLFELKNQYTIEIACSTSAINIIKEIYGIKSGAEKDWLTILNETACQHFLQMLIKIDSLYDLVIPSEGFELLLELVEMVFHTWELAIRDNRIVKCIKRNLPLNNLILNPILESELDQPNYLVLSTSRFDLVVNNLLNNESKPTWHMVHSQHITSATSSNDHKIIFLYSDRFTVDTRSKSISSDENIDVVARKIRSNTHYLSYQSKYDSVAVSSNQTFIAFGHSHGIIILYDINEKRSTCSHVVSKICSKNLEFTPDNKKILCVCQNEFNNKVINIFDIEHNADHTINIEFDLNSNIFIKISPNQKYIAINGNNVVRVFELFIPELYLTEVSTLNLGNVLLTLKQDANSVEFSQTNELILTVNNHNFSVWDISTKTIVSCFDTKTSENPIKNARFSANSKYIFAWSQNIFYSFSIKTKSVREYKIYDTVCVIDGN